MEENNIQIVDEQNFPFIGISKDEGNSYLNIIRNCKDIYDTENKVDGVNKCQIIQMTLRKENGVITFSGILNIGSENRTIEGELYAEKDKISVYYKIFRLGMIIERKEYTVFDEFKLENDTLIRKSRYDYDMKDLYDVVNDETLKGGLK